MAEAVLTKNQKLVLEALGKAEQPMSAYNLLDDLRSEGFKAPLQVYRAIEKLQEHGLVHRLESLNAFVACSHPSCPAHEAVIFMICNTCKRVDEVSSDKLGQQLDEISANNGFATSGSTVELRGNCANCKAA